MEYLRVSQVRGDEKEERPRRKTRKRESERWRKKKRDAAPIREQNDQQLARL
jgi:hypothetical protein